MLGNSPVSALSAPYASEGGSSPRFFSEHRAQQRHWDWAVPRQAGIVRARDFALARRKSDDC